MGICMKKIYVDPNGSNKNSGSSLAPFQTVGHALSIAGENTEIILNDGLYCEYDTWNIKKSHISIRGAHGTRPIISGGVNITGWRAANDPERPGLLCAALPDQIEYARNFYINGRRAERARSSVIPNDGWKLLDDPTMRFANKVEEMKSENKMLNVYDGYFTTKLELLTWRNKSDIEFVYDVGWTHCIVPVEDIIPAKDAEGKAFVKMREPCFRNCLTKGGVQIGSPNYIENAYELLEKPGQWYIDRVKRFLYYMPFENEDISSADCVLPRTKKFIDIMGTPDKPVENITVSGLTFAYSSWLSPSENGYAEIQANMLVDGKAESAVSLTMCENVRFEYCKFTRLGANAIDIGQGVSSSIINACKFEDVSGSGIQIGSFGGEKDAHPDDFREITRTIVISNNYLTGIGAEFKGSVGIIAGYVQDVDITHNEIEHASYTGISLGWGWGVYEPGRETCHYLKNAEPPPKYIKPTICMRNSVSYNHIHNVMEKLHDGAGIYTLGLQNGSMIKGNYVHDNCFSGEKHNETRITKVYLPHEYLIAYMQNDEIVNVTGEEEHLIHVRHGFPGGIYLDEATGGFYVSENMVHSVAIPLFIHDTGTKDRVSTNFIFDNSFNKYPDDENFPVNAARFAGIEREYRFAKKL